jgi:phosphatidylserine/phosphatidylglycerophosphate/cardiolipin synthase-like enzyme
MEKILKPGRNCWRIEPASRVAFLIDAEAYFKAFRAAVKNARRSIFILGWDIDSRLQLVRDGDDGRPNELCGFLNDAVERSPGLDAYVLIWDFAMIYAAEREMLPVYRLDWRTHRRLRFRMDDRHPAGGLIIKRLSWWMIT